MVKIEQIKSLYCRLKTRKLELLVRLRNVVHDTLILVLNSVVAYALFVCIVGQWVSIKWFLVYFLALDVYNKGLFTLIERVGSAFYTPEEYNVQKLYDDLVLFGAMISIVALLIINYLV